MDASDAPAMIIDETPDLPPPSTPTREYVFEPAPRSPVSPRASSPPRSPSHRAMHRSPRQSPGQPSPGQHSPGHHSPHLRSPQTPRTRLAPATPGSGSQDRQTGQSQQSQQSQPAAPTPTGPPRLVIHKLVLNNFKSYAGRQEIGPFNTNFSAVVGPNGSGKSNVIDSLLFVFGFRATKMRHTKLASLIHKSEQHPDLETARVEVHFQQVVDMSVGGPQKVDGSDLMVAREVSKHGGSTYYLNERISSYTAVTTLLKDRGIDLQHKRFLILQGEVESIALMKPKAEGDGDDGLLEYLEDIIGTSDYKPLIAEAEEGVEELKTECTEKRGRLDIAEQQLAKLDSRRQTIASAMRLHNNASHARSSLLQLAAYRASQRLATAQAFLTENQEKLAAEQQRNAEGVQKLEACRQSMQTKRHEVSGLQETAAGASSGLKQAQLAAVKIQSRLAQLQTKAKKLEKTLHASENDRTQAQQWLDNFDADAAQFAEQQTALSRDLNEQESALEALQLALHDKTKDIAAEMESVQAQLEPWREQIQAKDTEIRAVETEQEFVASRAEDLKAQFAAATEQAEKLIERGKAADAETKTLGKRLAAIPAQLHKIETEIESAETRAAAAEQAVAVHRGAVAAARSARDSQQTQGRMLTALLALRDKGELPGFYGRLGSLGTIDSQYDIAVSTAAPRLDDLVVDTVETGQRVIEYLKRNRLGSARVILLKEQRADARMDKFSGPANVQRLFDLVKISDPKFRVAFYSVLGDTLVARTPDEARKLAFQGPKRHKVVSLQGVLVQPSGMMSGGGQPQRGRMASKAVDSVSADKLAAMERELAGAEYDLNEARQSRQQQHTLKTELLEEQPVVQVNFTKAELSLNAIKEEILAAKTRRRELRAAHEERAAEDEIVLAQARDRQLGLKKEKQRLERESSSLEAQVEALQQRILDAGGLELRMQLSKVGDLRDQLAALRRRQADGSAERSAQLALVKRHAAIVAETKQALQTLDADLAAGEASQSRAAAAETELAERVADLQRQLVVLENELQELKDEVLAAQVAMDEGRTAEVELRNQISQYEQQARESQSAESAAKRGLQGLKFFDLSLAKDLRAELLAAAARSTETPADPAPATLNTEMADPDTEMVDAERAELAEPEPEPADAPEGPSELTPDELADLDEGRLRLQIEDADNKLSDVQIDMSVLDEYRRRFEEYVERREVAGESLARYDNAEEHLSNLKHKRYTEFDAGFQAISSKLKEMYQMITMGGNAELELVDHLDPFSEGVLFSVMPPKKSWRNIANLSGGEKTLSSLALVFALHHYKPTPLYVMDEIDAALDFRNVSIVANYIRERTSNGQFIVISLRNNMFEQASRLVGIYKVQNMTHSVTIQNTPRID